MTNTRDKLSEAKFFLEEMRKVLSESNKFRYILTAFLAANRSITLIMQKEFSRKSGFSDWYSKKRTMMKNNPNLKYLLKQRNLSLHERPMLQHPIGITQHAVNGEGINIFLTGTGNNLVSSSFVSSLMIQPVLVVKYYFDDIKDKDVITKCQESIDTLEIIVNECEKNFC